MSASDEQPSEKKPFTRSDAARLCALIAALAAAYPLLKIALDLLIDLAVEGRSFADAQNAAAHYAVTQAPHDAARIVFMALFLAPLILFRLRPELFMGKPVDRVRTPRPAVVMAAGAMIAAGALSTTLLFAGALHVPFAVPLSWVMDAYAGAVDAIARAAEGPVQSVLGALDVLLGGHRELDAQWLHAVIALLALVASIVLSAELSPRKKTSSRAARWLLMVPLLFFMWFIQATGAAVETVAIYLVVALVPFALGVYRLVVPAPAYTSRDMFRLAVPYASVAGLTLVLLLANLALQ